MVITTPVSRGGPHHGEGIGAGTVLLRGLQGDELRITKFMWIQTSSWQSSKNYPAGIFLGSCWRTTNLIRD